MIKCFAAVLLIGLFSTDIYQYSLPSIQKSQAIMLNSFKGKKILIVNTAANSPYADQYRQLEKLYQQYKNSLVIISVSSNSFGNEVADLNALNNIQQKYGLHYLCTITVPVKGIGMHPLYKWLTNQQENGIMNTVVKDDFQKYLIDKDGALAGVFASSVDPMSKDVIEAVQR